MIMVADRVLVLDLEFSPPCLRLPLSEVCFSCPFLILDKTVKYGSLTQWEVLLWICRTREMLPESHKQTPLLIVILIKLY